MLCVRWCLFRGEFNTVALTFYQWVWYELTPAKLCNVFTTVPLVQHSYMQSTFPSVFIALRIFLTLPVTNCEGERSFSHLARIKNELRTTQTQQRLSALPLIETELLRSLEFDEVITDFANRRARKKFF